MSVWGCFQLPKLYIYIWQDYWTSCIWSTEFIDLSFKVSSVSARSQNSRLLYAKQPDKNMHTGLFLWMIPKCMTKSPPVSKNSSPTDSHPLFVYLTGNLAHTKGKAINTMRSPRTPTRTITFAKVLTALSALSLYYLPHRELPLKSCLILFLAHYQSQEVKSSQVNFISIVPNHNRNDLRALFIYVEQV